MMTPFPKQQAAIEALVGILAPRPTAAALNSSHTGTGKTLCAVEVARRLGVPTFVVCPKVVVPSWRRTFAEQGVEVVDVINYEKLRRGTTPYGGWVGKDFIWRLAPGSLVIWDEVHRAQGAYTQNARMVVGAKLCGLRSMALSATAAEDPTEMRALGYLLDLHNLRNFVSWAMAHGCQFDQWGKLEFTKSASASRAYLEKLHSEIYPSKGVKVTRDDLAEFFHDGVVINEPLDFGDDGAIAKIYREMEQELASLKEQSKDDKQGHEACALVEQLRARQKVELLKVPVILELIENAVSEGRSVAVFVNFEATIAALRERLGSKCGLVVGGQSEEERSKAVDAFQRNETPVILCNIAAGGLGVSLHDTIGDRPRTALISPSFNAKELQQTLGRVDRAGAKSSWIQQILVASGTVEEKIAHSITYKTRNMETLHKAETLPDVAPVTPVVEEPAHAKYSPSSLKYREISPRFTPRDGTSAASEKGTRIHYACETGDFSQLANDEERHMAELLIEGVRRIFQSHGWEEGSFERHNEIRLYIKTGEQDTFGTCDVLALRGDEAIMLDYKTGVGVIDSAEENLQAQCYVAGGFQKFGNLKKIHFYFLVPQRDEILFHTYERSELPRLLLRVQTVITRSSKAAECHPREEICQYCAHLGDCKDVARKFLPFAQRYAKEGFELPEGFGDTELDTPEKLAANLRLAKIAKEWAEKVEFRAKQKATEEGWQLPGFKVIQINYSPKVLSSIGAYRALSEKMPVEDFLACAEIDLGKVEEYFAARAPRGQKGKVSEEVVGLLKDAGVLDDGRVGFQLRQNRK